MAEYLEDYFPVVRYNGLNTNKNIDFSGSAAVLLPSNTLVNGSGLGTYSLGTVTSPSAHALAVGLNGATGPAFNIDASTALQADGVNVKGLAQGNGAQVSVITTGTNAPLTIDAAGSGAITIAGTSTGALGIGVSTIITSASANALTVGRQGSTAPQLKIDASTSTVATGIQIKGAAAGAGVALSAITSGTNETLKIDAASAGLINIGGTSTGLNSIGRGVHKVTIQGTNLTSIATQNATATAAQLLGGFLTHASTTGPGALTLDTGTNISGAITGVATGDKFTCIYANTGNQTVTLTNAASGTTLVGNVTVLAGYNAVMTFYCTGSNTWNVYTIVSA